MSRREVPLIPRTLRATADVDVVVHAELVLGIKTVRGAWKLLPFLVDSGTQITTTSDTHAPRFHLVLKPVPREFVGV
jgi:hypothetical protein